MNGIRYRASEEFKDSGIEWIGEIPKEWQLKKTNLLFNIIGSGSTPNTDNTDYYNGEINWLQTGDLNDAFLYSTSKSVTILAMKKTSALKIYPVNTLIVAMYGATICKLGITKISTSTNQACCCLAKPANQYITRYVFYWILANRPHIISLAYGGGQPNINREIISNLKISIPSEFEQHKTINFLDIKTTQFDSIIAKKEQLIAKLEEAKKALISEVVTGKAKIVDGKLVSRQPEEMKDSGVEWLGQISNEWKSMHLKHLFRVKKKSIYSDNKVVLSVTQKGIKIKDIESNEGQLAETYSGYQEVLVNDFVMNHMDLLTGFVDCSTYVGVTSPDYRVFQLTKTYMSRRYYLYIFQMCYYCKIFYSLGQGVSNFGRWRLPIDMFYDFILPMPPAAEQYIIADFLDIKTAQFDSLIAKQQQILISIKSAKQSLISEAVTGKIDLRDWEIVKHGGAS